MNNTFTHPKEYVRNYLRSEDLGALIQWFESNPVAFVKFTLRAVTGELPLDYWRRVVRLRYPELYDVFNAWIYHVKKDKALKQKLIELIADNIVEKLHDIKTVEIPYLPRKGIILDIGSGYLSMSKQLVIESLRNKNLELYLIDNAEIPCKVAIEVINKIGSPKNVRVLRVSADQLPFNDNSVDAVTLLGTFHELSWTIFNIELHRNMENLKVDYEHLERAVVEYKPFIREFHRVLKIGGKLIIIDKIMDAYNADYVEKIMRNVFKVLNKEKKERKFILIFEK